MWRGKVAAGCLLAIASIWGFTWDGLTSPVNLVVTAHKDLIRFQAQGPVQELRVEILSLAGQKLVDSGIVYGSTLDWRLGNDQRMLAANGVYLYDVTVKDASSQPSKYQGKLVILRGMIRASQSTVVVALPTTGSSAKSAQPGTIQLPDLTRSQNFIDEMPIKIHLSGPQKSAGKRHINDFDLETLLLSGEFRDVINGDYRDKLVDLDGDHIADGVIHCSQTLLADPLLVDIFVDLLLDRHDVEVLDAGFVDIDLLAFARRPQCEFEFFDDTFAPKKSSHRSEFVKVRFTGTLTDRFHVSFDEVEGDFNDDGQDEILACEADIRFTVRRSLTVIIEIDTGDIVQVSSRGGTLALRARHRDVSCEII